MKLYEIYREGWEETGTVKYYKSNDENAEDRIKHIVEKLNIQMQKDDIRADELMRISSDKWNEELDKEYEMVIYTNFYLNVNYRVINIEEVEEI